MTPTQRNERSREIRLWIGQIVVPGLTVAASTLAIPEVRQAISAKCQEVKWKIEQRFNKEKG